MKNNCIPVRKRLFTNTVPLNKEHLTGTVPVNKEHLTCTVPVNKEHLTGTLWGALKIKKIKKYGNFPNGGVKNLGG